MTVLGQVVLVLAGVLSLGAAVGYGRIVPGRAGSLVFPRMLMATSTTLVVIASAILTALFLTHDFSNGYVFAYSDRSLPLHFLLSSFYAGQEGSFLFWVLCSSLIAVALSGFSRKHGTEAEVMTVFLLVQTALIGLALFKSPFISIWAKYADLPVGQLPADGRGLNPLLQNFWMVIHPPVLFIGFALMAVPYSQAIAGLWTRKPTLLSDQGLSWTLLTVSILGLGIMLGAYWAYGVLGWGGYWGWDPVENSSLVPWITAAALVHTLVAQRRTGQYAKTNLALAVVSYFLVIYSTFLTRSGILGDASVHAFADGGAGIYWLLLAFMVAICSAGLIFIILRAKDLAGEQTAGGWLTRETMLAAGSIVLLLSATVILFGTSLPIFSTTRVETSFYDSTNLPLAILIAFLIGISLYTQWEEHDVRYTARKMWKSLLAAIAATLLCVVLGMNDVATGGLVFTALFALFVNVDTGVRILRGDPLFLGGKIAHIGIAIFFLGVVATGKYSTKEHVVLPRGTSVQALGHTLTYTGFNVTKDQKYVLDVRADRGSTSFTLHPVMFDAGEQGIMRNPDIVSHLTQDFYLSPQSLEPPEDGSRVTEFEFEKGQTRQIGEATVTFTGFEVGEHMGGGMSQMSVERGVAAILAITKGTHTETLTPRIVPSPDAPPPVAVPSVLLDGEVQLLAMNIGMGQGPSQVTIGIQQAGQQAPTPDVLVAEASIKPFVNLLWAGTVIMMIGFGLAIVKRWRE